MEVQILSKRIKQGHNQCPYCRAPILSMSHNQDDESLDSSNNGNETIGENNTVAIEPSKYENWETVPGSGVAAYPVV